MPDTITFHLDCPVLVYLLLRLSIGFGFPMVFRLPVLIRLQFLEVSPSREVPNHRVLPVRNRFLTFSLVLSAFLGFPLRLGFV